MEWVGWYNNRRMHSVPEDLPRPNTKLPTTLNSGRPRRDVFNMKPA